MRVAGLLCLLLLTSLVSAGFFTEKKKDADDVTVREAVVIELDRNAKVSVSPHHHADQEQQDVGEKLQGTSRVNEAIGKARDTVARTVNTASDKAQEMKERATDAATQVSSKAKEQAERAKQQTYDAVIGNNNNNKDTVLKDVAKAYLISNKQGGPRGSVILRRILGFIVSPVTRMASSSSSSPSSSWAMGAGGVLHLLGFAVAYGTSAWVSFGSNYVLGKALPRQQLGMVQSKVYRLYYTAMVWSVGMALLGHLVGHWRKPGLLMLQAFNLMASLVMILLNLLYLEPRTTQVVFERMKKEKEEGAAKEGYTAGGRAVDPPVTGTETSVESEVATTTGSEAAAAAAKPQSRILLGRLRRTGVLNSYSSLLDALTLVSLTWHLFHLGHNLHAVC